MLHLWSFQPPIVIQVFGDPMLRMTWSKGGCVAVTLCLDEALDYFNSKHSEWTVSVVFSKHGNKTWSDLGFISTLFFSKKTVTQSYLWFQSLSVWWEPAARLFNIKLNSDRMSHVWMCAGFVGSLETADYFKNSLCADTHVSSFLHRTIKNQSAVFNQTLMLVCYTLRRIKRNSSFSWKKKLKVRAKN